MYFFLELEMDDDNDNDEEEYRKENFYQVFLSHNKSRKRKKRQADQYEYTPTKTRCPLLLVADYRFFQEMGGGNTKTTINYLVSSNGIYLYSASNLFPICLQISLIDRVHKIYNDTVWQDRSDQEGFKGMGFVIKKIVVHSEPTRLRGGEAHYNMIREKWDVRNLLEVIFPTIYFLNVNPIPFVFACNIYLIRLFTNKWKHKKSFNGKQESNNRFCTN